MRTYVQLRLRQVEPPTPDEAVRKWLEDEGLRPQTAIIADTVREMLRTSDVVPPDRRVPSDDTADDHAVEIFSAIPLHDFERAHALRTARYVIHYDDTANGATVWGLVCVDRTTVTIRFRHRSAKSLERATEELIRAVWDHAGDGKLFNPFESEHRVPVREPLSTSDAYSGRILGTLQARVARARYDKRIELRTLLVAVVAFVICTFGGFYYFTHSLPNEIVRWLSGAFDRVATTALATGAISYLAYRAHVRELVSKPVIVWE